MAAFGEGSLADLSRRIAEDSELSTLLANAFEFDVERKVESESSRLASGVPLECIAGDFTGGMFYLCGPAGYPRPVLYASSEGEAGVVAANLGEALELVVGLPCWRDALGYSEGGDLGAMESATELLYRDIAAGRSGVGVEQLRVAALLDITLVARSVLVARLHEAVKSAGPGFTFADETGEYGTLFGPFSTSRNVRWR